MYNLLEMWINIIISRALFEEKKVKYTKAKKENHTFIYIKGNFQFRDSNKYLMNRVYEGEKINCEEIAMYI